MTNQTIKALINDPRPVITPQEAADVLQCNRYAINDMVKRGKCPFPAFMIGSRVKIPRIKFLQYLGYLKEDAE